MRGPTHALVGLTALAAAERATDFIQPHLIRAIPAGLALCAGAALVGALAPDIDTEHSTISRELGLAGRLVSASLRLVGIGHRGLTHTGLIALLVGLMAWLGGSRLGYPDVGLAFGLGYASHLLADGLTKRGIPLWKPLPGQLHLLPRPLRVRTGSPAEGLLFLAAGLGLAWLLPEIVPVELVAWVGG